MRFDHLHTLRSVPFQVIPNTSVKSSVNGSALLMRSHQVLGNAQLNKLVPVPSTSTVHPIRIRSYQHPHMQHSGNAHRPHGGLGIFCSCHQEPRINGGMIEIGVPQSGRRLHLLSSGIHKASVHL